MFASLFTTLFVQPIFNLLVFIYAIIPGHNFGLAIILFTIIVRYIMYPLVKKQLLHTQAMRSMQPELKRIKKEAAGDRQKESALTMELYKERKINPLASLGLIAVQIPLFLALFAGLRKIVANPQAMIDFSYTWVRNLSWMKQLGSNIHLFDNSLFGIVDLGRKALESKGGIYIPAMIIVVASSVTQYFQIKQTSPTDKDSRKLRQILKDAGTGKTADQTEVNAALGRNMSYVFPFLIFMLTVSFAAALSLYWFVGGLVAFLQQDYLLKKDRKALEAVGNMKPTVKKAEPIEAVIIETNKTTNSTPKTTTKTAHKKKSEKRKKRR